MEEFDLNSFDTIGTNISTLKDEEPKNKNNMNKFVQNMVQELEKYDTKLKSNRKLPDNNTIPDFNKMNDMILLNNEPKPINVSNDMIKASIPIVKKKDNSINTNINISIPKKSYEYKDIIILVLLFMILNNKFIIELIYKLPITNSYLNLMIRSIIFILSLYLVKKITNNNIII